MGDIFGIGSLAGSIMANQQATEAQDEAKRATRAAVNQIQAVGAGPDLSRQILLQQYKQAGILTPQMEQQVNAHFQQIQGVSQPVQQAQQQALQQMSQVAKGGLTSQDRMALSQLQNATARQNTAQQNAILQNMQERGLIGRGDTGAELAMRLQAQQGNANQASQGGLQISSEAAQRALQGIAGLGNLSGQQAGQQFQQNAQQAGIANEQQRFNTANQLAQQQRNVAAQNQAQQYNLGTAQGISNANVGNANAEQLREMNAQQQMYQNKMAQAQAAANAQIGQGTQIANFGRENAGATAGMFAGAGNVAEGVYGKYGGGSGNNSSGYTTLEKDNQLGQGPTAPGSSSGIGSYSDKDFWQGGEVPGYCGGGEIGYSNGGTVSNMHFHGNGVTKHPNFPSNPVMHTINPMMLTDKPMEFRQGGMVPGPQVVPGSSPQNDIIPARLSSGEYVVPKEDAPSMELIHQILKGMKKRK